MEVRCYNSGQYGDSWADLALKHPPKGAVSHMGPISSPLIQHAMVSEPREGPPYKHQFWESEGTVRGSV